MVGKKKILVVDDESEMIEIVRLRLEATGRYEVEEALDGLEAIKKLGTFKPDLMILDIVMPEIDGWEVCRRVHSNPQTANLPIIAVTAGKIKDLSQMAEEFGVTQFFQKPYEDQELVEVIAKILN